MTSFAALQKSASRVGLLSRVGNTALDLVRHGVWSKIGEVTAKSQSRTGKGFNRLARAFVDPDTKKMTTLNKGLTAYGLGGLVSGALGYNVPGSSLAFNVSMPGAGAIFTAPSLVTLARAGTDENKNRMRQDAEAGSRLAAEHFLTAINSDPSVAYRPGSYAHFMQGQGLDLSRANKYRRGEVPEHLSRYGYLSSLFEDPQKILNNRMDQEIAGGFRKTAALKALGKVLPWTVPVFGTGALAYSALRDKPYDEGEAQGRGYSAAQAKIQEALDNMSGVERMAARLDPSLVAKRLEAYVPGTIKSWEQNTGQRFNPGFLTRTVDAWDRRGKGKYYTYDMSGNRRYIS